MSSPTTPSTTSPTIFLPAAPNPKATNHALIYFISGNPGLITYYADFLSFLSSMIQASDITQTAYDIYGRDLRGFRDEDHSPPFGVDGTLPWDLEGQIESVYDNIAAQRRTDNGVSNNGETKGQPYDFVVLMGHSVGAYIAVEIFSRHTKQATSRAPHLSLRNGILLFPTITDIALSPSGKRMTMLESIPWLGDRAHTAAGLALSLLTEGMLRWIVENVMGFSPHAAAVTAAWLKSRDGVWQALHLGRSEMRTIKEDEWEDELWHVADAADGEQRPRFYLFYGKEDHWVASRLRDEFVEKKKGRARVAIDEGDVPHAFCTRERPSWLIAKKVSGWVEEIEGIRRHKA